MALNDREIAKLETDRRKDLADDQVPGLSLRVTPGGAKTWALRYRVGGGRNGRLRRLTLGRYPTVTIAEARKRANRELRKVDAGEDPAAEKMAQRQGETVGDLAKDYLEKHAKVHKRSWKEDDRILNANILPVWKHRKVAELTRRDVRDLIESVAARGAAIMANRTLALVRKMLNFAIAQDWIEANVASLIQKPGAERSRERVLTDDEIRLVWAAAEAERLGLASLTKLRLVTAQRGGELAALRWTDVDGDWVTIPAAIAKNGRAHRVFLTKTAQDILDALPRLSDELVFPGRSNRQPLGDAKKGGQRIAARVLVTLRKRDPKAQFDFRAHDLRRTAATRMAAAGVPQADIAKVLNHVEGGPRATQVYDRYSYDREKRIALETWERELVRILEDAPQSGRVVPMARAR
jgi:integrase